MELRQEDIQVVFTVDRPDKGMWHCGPNNVWAEVTHLPTMICVRHYGGPSHHKLKSTAMSMLELLVEDARGDVASFPEKVKCTPQGDK